MDLKEHQRPIVYHPEYNISIGGIENLHPFDSKKWERVVGFLKDWGLIKDNTYIQPAEPSQAQLAKIHSEKYLKSLEKSRKVAGIIEVATASCIPMCLLENHLLHPLRLQTGGSLLAAELALQHKWAINIGGGFHHASYDSGGGFCVFADISLAIKELLSLEKIQTAIVVDLDAHQGNGHARDFAEHSNIFIFDMFNPNVYPQDREARQFISHPVYVDRHTTNQNYLSQLRKNLASCLALKKFDILVYNAGTDCLISDKLGQMNLSSECIITRDEIVFDMARTNNIPIFMLTSGGYQKNNAEIIARSIRNLHNKKLIEL